MPDPRFPAAAPRRSVLTSRAAWAPAAALLAAACGAPPPAAEPGPPPPASWSAPHRESGAAAGAWWRSLDAPQMHAYVERALARNLDLRAAAARVEAAAAQARAVTGERLPELHAALELSRSRRNFIGFPVPGGAPGEVFSVTTDEHRFGASAAWELDLWGRLRAAEQAARADYAATDADSRAARASIAARTARAWCAWSDAHRQWRIARAARDVAGETLDLQRLRFRGGSGSAAAVDAAAAALARAAADAEERRRTLEARARALQLLAGAYPDAVMETPAALPELPAPVPAGVPAAMVARRPDLRAAAARVEAARARGREARAALYPSLSLTASGGTVSDDLRKLLDGDFRVWSLGAGLTAPLFQGGRLRARADAAEARRRAAELAFAQNALTAFAEVEGALAAEQRIRAHAERLAAALQRERAALRSATERFRAGTGDARAVLEARAAVLRARASRHAARRLLLENRIDLHRALGGGIPDPAPPPSQASPASPHSS